MFTIVKHAAKSVWHAYYETDPKQGVLLSHSSHKTYTGQQIGVKESYTDEVQARKDCQAMNIANPVGGYAVCPIINGSSNGNT